MVKEAIAAGYDAEGIEPSRWLAEQARARGANVKTGVLPHADVQGPFDLIALIDVIEHVKNPVETLSEINSLLAPNGYLLLVTPDVDSVAARLMGSKWWHLRIAHIGYFNSRTLDLACRSAGFKVVHRSRPWWYFSGDYLWERFMVYMPKPLRFSPPQFMQRVTLPLNLFDSLLYVVQKIEEPEV